MTVHILPTTRRNEASAMRYLHFYQSRRIFLRNCSSILVATVLLAAAGFMYFAFPPLSIYITNFPTKRDHSHTLPTLLSVVDETTGQYLVALDNPLYDRLKEPEFIDDYNVYNKAHPRKLQAPPELFLDRSRIQLYDNLTLTWTLGKSETGEALVQEDDILVLYCSDSQQSQKNNDWSHKNNWVEAATIAQAKATSRKHGGSDLSATTIHAQDNSSSSPLSTFTNTWFIPSFPVLRQAHCHFTLFHSIPNSSKLAFLASSGTLHIEKGETIPTAIHLALGNDIDEMVVQFKTGDQSSGVPVVRFGRMADTDTMMDNVVVVKGSSHTYSARDMCEEPASSEEPGKFRPPGMIHVVRLTGLEPNTTYQYQAGFQHQVGDSYSSTSLTATTTTTTTTWSKTFTFTSAPLVKADSEPFSYIVYGDQGCPSRGWGEGGVWTAAMTARELNDTGKLPIRAVHHFGDLSYAVGVAHIWDEWFHMISSFAPYVPLMIAVGNHEYGYHHMENGNEGKDPSGALQPYQPRWGNFRNDSGGECGVPTANLFTMPNSSRAGTSNGVFWYSSAFANVHTTVLSSEHDLSPGSVQYQWLEADLASVDRSITPWLILELHRPLYESEEAWYDYPVTLARRMELEDLLKAYQVDVVLAGHYHSYLRTCNGLYQGQCNNGGPTHITIGSAGALLDHVGLFPNSWTEAFLLTYGYGRITVANASALHFEFVKAGSPHDPDAGKVLDDVWIVRDERASLSTATQWSESNTV